MISIIVLYSPDREPLWDISRKCLEDCHRFGDCQLILCCDRTAPTHHDPAAQRVIVPRRRGMYCWADAINAGIEKADFDRILYLDCDRILSPGYLSSILQQSSDGDFLYSSALYRLKAPAPYETICSIRDGSLPLQDYTDPDYRLTHDYNPRTSGIRVGKGPFSGNCSFSKSTYRKSGGVDPAFLGAGYVDQEYWFRCKSLGCTFRTILCNELHLYHPASMFCRLEGIWNCHYMAQKHSLGLAPVMAARLARFDTLTGGVGSHPSCKAFRNKLISLMP